MHCFLNQVKGLENINCLAGCALTDMSMRVHIILGSFYPESEIIIKLPGY